MAKERYIKIDGTYYPIGGVLFHVDKQDHMVYIFGIGRPDNVVEIITGRQAVELLGLLDELSFEITGEDE